MVEQRKEATVYTSKTLRMLAATAVVSALAILLTSPAQAYLPNEGGGSVTATTTIGNPGDSAWISLESATAAQTVGNPGDSAWIAQGTATGAQTVGNPGDGAQVSQPIESVATSSGRDGFDTGTFLAFASGAVLLLVLGAGALLFTARHRRVALP